MKSSGVIRIREIDRAPASLSPLMPNQGSPGKPRDRVQIDFTKQGMADLDQMRDDLEVRSRGAVLRLGLSVLRWILQEKRRGRRIVSEGPQGGDRQQIVLLLADIEDKTEGQATRAQADDGDGPDLSGSAGDNGGDERGDDARAEDPRVLDEDSNSTEGPSGTDEGAR